MSDLEQMAQSASSVITPAELHGLVCGFASAGEQQFSLSDFVALAGADALSDEAAVSEFVSASLDVLYSQDMEFSPLIPDDDENLAVRLAALSEWCAGYLSGFGAVVAAQTLPPDVQEILRDFAAISGLDDDVDGDEQDENSFMEIYEYVRVAAVLTLTLMNTLDEEGGAEA